MERSRKLERRKQNEVSQERKQWSKWSKLDQRKENKIAGDERKKKKKKKKRSKLYKKDIEEKE